MTGKILDFSIRENSGIISGSDGNRYSFLGSEWRGNNPPSKGMLVDFDINGKIAIGVYSQINAPPIISQNGVENKNVFLGLNQTGTIAFILLLFICFPVCWLPFLISSCKYKEDV